MVKYHFQGFLPQKGGISCAFNTCCLLFLTSTGLLWEGFSSKSAGSLLFAFCFPGEATSHFLSESCGNPCSLRLSIRQSQVSRNSPIMLIIWIQYRNVLAYGDNHARDPINVALLTLCVLSYLKSLSIAKTKSLVCKILGKYPLSPCGRKITAQTTVLHVFHLFPNF